MEIITYLSPLPEEATPPGSYVERNPNLSYLLYGKENGQALMIDACGDIGQVKRDLQNRKLLLEGILLTHFHHDHVFYLYHWLKHYPEVWVGIHRSSYGRLHDQGVEKVRLFSDGEVVEVDGFYLHIWEAPGHTVDSLCFWDDEGKNIFTGDVLMGGVIGCSDYRRGGNRNSFYRTLRKLLAVLPPEAKIYPGHFSEHYCRLPPYDFASERERNPYVRSCLRGERGAFDRQLKLFSLEFERGEIRLLDLKDLEEICRLEKEIWIPPLQAPRELIEKRLLQGHRMLSFADHGVTEGVVSWCYSSFSLKDGVDAFPDDFYRFSACSSCEARRANSAFIYNVGVIPEARGRGTGGLLLQEAFAMIRKEGIAQVFIDSRLPSYEGSYGFPQEEVPQNPVFKEAIDTYFATGCLPPEDILRKDPAVSFYLKNGLTPWCVKRNFIHDPPSGNLRLICYANLVKEDEGDVISNFN